MKKKELNPFEVAGQILQALPAGILLTTKAGDDLDTMVIGWGGLGMDWQEKTFTVFVRQSRYTKTLLDRNPYFTINVPVDTPHLREIIQICGTKSGRDIDKFQEAGLDPVDTGFPVPAIAQLPLSLECEVIYVQDQNPEAIDGDLYRRWYPDGDDHTMYVGRIVSCYLLEDD